MTKMRLDHGLYSVTGTKHIVLCIRGEARPYIGYTFSIFKLKRNIPEESARRLTGYSAPLALLLHLHAKQHRQPKYCFPLASRSTWLFERTHDDASLENITIEIRRWRSATAVSDLSSNG